MEPIAIVGIIGIGVAVFFGAWGSWRTGKMQQAQFKHDEAATRRRLNLRLLDEIIEWTKDIMACVWQVDACKLMVEAEVTGKLIVEQGFFTNTRDIFARSEYIGQIVSAFGGELLSSLEQTNHFLSNAEGYIHAFQEEKERGERGGEEAVTFSETTPEGRLREYKEQKEPVDALVDCMFELESAANDLRCEATRLKLSIINEGRPESG